MRNNTLLRQIRYNVKVHNESYQLSSFNLFLGTILLFITYSMHDFTNLDIY